MDLNRRIIHLCGGGLALLCAIALVVDGIRWRLALMPDEASAARAALFNTGNGYLRRAMRDSADPGSAAALIELAKQQYRDLLSLDPTDWDARFNLERALRLAPEEREAFEQPEDRPVQRPPDEVPQMLEPDLP
jgi:mxaK protein